MSYRTEVYEGRFDSPRHIFGLVASSCAATFVSAVVLGVVFIAPSEGPIGAFIVLVMWFPVLLMVVGTISAVVGSATSTLLWRLGFESAWYYAGAGSLLGTFLAAWLSGEQDYVPDTLSFFAEVGGLSGATWGIVWWFTARQPSVAQRSA